MVGFGRTTANTVEGAAVSTLQFRVNDEQSIDGMAHMQMFGFQSALPVGTDVVRVSVSGDLINGVVVASNHQPSRMGGMKGGGSRMHDSAGNQVLIGNDNTINATAAASVTSTAPETFVTGNLHVGTGASGTFATSTGNIVTVRDGIITNIF